MSKLKVIRASAGSGKTYRITSEYLRLLFLYPYNYKHILAVTFTNKATEEMKSRILGELFKLSNEQPSSHLASLMQESSASETEIRQKAKLLLNTILHNYSRFTVSTIDSFFQRVIKSFAREAGIQYNFEVALDTGEIIEKAADQLLLKLENDATLLEWLVQFAEDRIEEGKNWDFKKEVIKLGHQLFNEEFRSFPLSFHKKIANREGVKSIQQQLFAVKATFESKLLTAGKEGWQMITKNGFTVSDFKYGKNGGVGQFFYKLSQGNITLPSKRILDASENIDHWLPKETDEASKVKQIADTGLFKLLQEVQVHFSNHYASYITASEILSNFYTLGILADLSTEITQYANENNLFVLAESGPFLKAIIGDNDVPFIYEKTGQTYNHFMIDEFQDTSGIQWFNFKPLITNSLAQQKDCMVVGDVKQSIYRWRNSDWKIMAQQLQTDMHDFGIKNETLDFNWRSKINIVAFNNSFFKAAPQTLQNYFNSSLSETATDEGARLNHIIVEAYADFAQKVAIKSNEGEGYIKIRFFDNTLNDWEQQSLQELPAIIENLQRKNHSLKDIAILTRTASEGRDVVEFLNNHKQQLPPGYPFRFDVLSNESAFLKNSPVVNFIIEIFNYLVNPNDAINSAALVNDYLQIENIPLPENPSWNPIKSLPSYFIENTENLKLLAPDELFEKLINIFSLNQKTEFLPFVQALHGFIVDFMQQHSANLNGFLEYWDEKKATLSVSVSENQDAIRVLTIHKSKGLEFKNVIIPFCNWKLEHTWPHVPNLWCSSSLPPFNNLEFHLVRYSSRLQESHFSQNYLLEKAQSLVDNLNLLYVAFTRTADNLFLFCPLPKKDNKLSAAGELLYQIMHSESSILTDDYPSLDFQNFWNEPENIFEFGEISTLKLKQQNSINEIPLVTYQSIEIKEKLRQHISAKNFWESVETGKSSTQVYGNMMHRLFQNISSVNDIESSVKSDITEGLEQSSEQLKMIDTIKKLLNQQPFNDWFSGNWETLNETAIVVPGQHMYRPDRVMLNGKKAVVVDYKFGQKKKQQYNTQVKEYIDYLSEMDFESVEGYVWYVNLNELEKVA